jgi:two-component system sensor histidine kinase KdpD
VLYLFAVLPVAALWGLPFAIPVSVVSMLAFNWFFLPPTHTFQLADSENWVALAVYLVTAVSVSELAARARRRTAEAEQRRREAALAAEISAMLLESRQVEPQLGEIAALAAPLLGAAHARVELRTPGEAAPEELSFDLGVGDRVVGHVFVDSDADPDPEVAARVVATIASLLAAAIDREQLAERARDAESLRRSDAVKTAVLRSVSHDLRSPITAIMAASDVLTGSGELTEHEREELLDSIRLQVRRLDRLVANLLDLSRLEAGAASPSPELWTIDGLLARALEALGPDNERVDIELPDDSPAVNVDPAQLEHALVNLLENAIKFSPPTREVSVRIERAGGDVVIRVTDDGPGIPVVEQEHIFEPFTRGSSVDGTRGSGLGLAISRGFVQLNGGRLWVEAHSEGGATFALALRAVEIPAASPL